MVSLGIPAFRGAHGTSKDDKQALQYFLPSHGATWQEAMGVSARKSSHVDRVRSALHADNICALRPGAGAPVSQ
jgi:hypothetical protein